MLHFTTRQGGAPFPRQDCRELRVEKSMNPAVFRLEIVVPDSAIDANGHVNNVQYVQWIQDAATAHSAALGWTAERYRTLNSHWIVRSHNIEYRHSAYAGDLIWVQTWVSAFKRIKSLRKFRFFRPCDGVELAKAATLFILCDNTTGHPVSIPEAMIRDYPLVAEADEPK